jgi:sialate O-acetylesterase
VKNESSGPTLLKHTIQKNKIILQFNNASNGLVINGTKLTHIAIAANDKKFFWAEATIKHNRIIVQSKNVLNPVAVRYAWADCPISANLFNSNGLPASPFRTDNW